MNSILLGDEEPLGFSFRNCRRNDNLIQNGFESKQATKTGTTIVGIVFKDGIVLGADTRATAGSIVCDKNCQKIYYIQDNIYCCGAGTSADMMQSTRYIEANMTLIRQNSNRKFVPVVAAARFAKQYLRRFKGKIKSWLILGGIDNDGPHIYTVHPLGSSDHLPYATLGSGSLPAMSVFETRWKPEMNQEEAMLLVRDAVRAGIMNDLGSGSKVDICVIRKNFHQLMRGFDITVERNLRSNDYTPARGTTGVLSCNTIPIEIVEEKVKKLKDEENMEVE